jgi:hypothetical protein
MKLEFSGQFLKNTQTSNFVKIRPVGAELFHVDRWIDEQACRSTQRFFTVLQMCLKIYLSGS